MTALIEREVPEKILLVGVELPQVRGRDVDESLDELAQLVETAGAAVVGRMVQRRDRPDPATYVGRGKVEELHVVSEQLDVDTVVFDCELSPAQQWNLEKVLRRSAIDRCAVVLDIFAQNAKSREGRIQVELAQLRYRLPRLRGKGLSLSQQAGGIGTRGPGETRLEVDRRRLLQRIGHLERELKALDATRRSQRRLRHRTDQNLVTLVGYTNAGKSSVMNVLTGAGVEVDSRLFSTLDPRTRRLSLPGGSSVLLSDTVGFVRSLPVQLLDAFRSTLEVATEADALLHVVDGSHPDARERIDVVEKVLFQIGAGELPRLLVVNKADLDRKRAMAIARSAQRSVVVSAVTGTGMGALVAALRGFFDGAGAGFGVGYRVNIPMAEEASGGC